MPTRLGWLRQTSATVSTSERPKWPCSSIRVWKCWCAKLTALAASVPDSAPMRSTIPMRSSYSLSLNLTAKFAWRASGLHAGLSSPRAAN